MNRIIPITVHSGAEAKPGVVQQRPVAAGPPPVFLWVADSAISEADIAREMQHHRGDQPQQVRAAAARALVVRELLRRESQRLGVDGEAAREASETAEEAAIRQLIEREVSTPAVDLAACQRYYQQNQERLHHPDRIALHHILLAAAPADVSARIAVSQQAEELITELREHPQHFADLAMRHSACPSREQGGELGWIQRGDTVPEFERQVFMLRRNGLAPLPVETRYGQHIVSVDAIERGAAMSFEEAQPRIAAYLETQVKQNALSQYLQILAERYKVRGLEAFDAS